MEFGENSEYIVKAKDFYFYKNQKRAQLVFAALICIFDVYILIQFIANKWNTIGIIIFILLLGISLLVVKIKYSILIKNKKIYIERFFKKYEINYYDLITFKKKIESYKDANGYYRDACYLVIQYLCDDKIKIIKDSYGLKEDEIDELCENFITNIQLELINKMDENDRLKKINDISKEYFDIERSISTETMENMVFDYDKTQVKLKTIVVIIGIVVFLAMFLRFFIK